VNGPKIRNTIESQEENVEHEESEWSSLQPGKNPIKDRQNDRKFRNAFRKG
jgi:hypothetical protein